METFIVRIYRKNPNRPDDIVGRIEYISGDEETSFHSMDDLIAVIRSACNEEDDEPSGKV